VKFGKNMSVQNNKQRNKQFPVKKLDRLETALPIDSPNLG
jgi:hypothetical protein